MKLSILIQIIKAIILIQLICISSCRKPEYIRLSEDFKSYVIFPEGSYWVYEEINSGFIDTITNEKVSIDLVPERTESNIQVEQGNIQYQTKKSGRITGWIQTTTETKGCYSLSSFILYNSNKVFKEIKEKKILDVGNDFFCCCDSGFHSRFNPFIEYSGVLDSISVSGKFYSNVKLFTNIIKDTLLIEQNPGIVLKSYYARNIGLIKWEKLNGDVWELIEYKIN